MKFSAKFVPSKQLFALFKNPQNLEKSWIDEEKYFHNIIVSVSSQKDCRWQLSFVRKPFRKTSTIIDDNEG